MFYILRGLIVRRFIICIVVWVEYCLQDLLYLLLRCL